MPGNIQSSLTNFAAVQKAILLRDANKEKDLLDKSNLTLAIDACTSSDTFLQNLLRLSQQIIKDEDSDLDTKKNQIKDIATRVNSQGKTALNLALEEQNFLAAAFLINNESSWNNKCEGAFATAMHTNSKTVNSYYGYYGSDNYRNANFGQGRFEHHIVKKYGLTLGVELTAKDGTTSQYGYTGPALEELTDKIKSHSATNEKFVEIYEANAATLSACNYYGSLPKNPNAAKILSAKIQATCSDSAQGVVNIPCGYAQHSLGVSVVDGYLVVTNRRNEPGSVPGTKIYKITEPSKYSPEIINTLIGGAGNSIPEEDVLKALYAGVNPVPVLEIRQKGQKHDNCTVANPKSSIAGVLFVQHAREYGGVEKVLKSTSLKDKVLKQSHEEYKIFTKELRVSTAMELITDVKAKREDADVQNLAVEYLNQQYKEQDAEIMRELYASLAPSYQEHVDISIRKVLGEKIKLSDKLSGLAAGWQSAKLDLPDLLDPSRTQSVTSTTSHSRFNNNNQPISFLDGMITSKDVEGGPSITEKFSNSLVRAR